MSLNDIIVPVSGFITSIQKLKDGSLEIHFYIPREANHKIYSPISGKIESLMIDEYGKLMKNEQGEFIFAQKEYETHDASLSWFIKSIVGKLEIKLQVFVGYPHYITNKIRLVEKIDSIKKNNTVVSGELLGEILIGSSAILTISGVETKQLENFNDFYDSGRFEELRSIKKLKELASRESIISDGNMEKIEKYQTE